MGCHFGIRIARRGWAKPWMLKRFLAEGLTVCSGITERVSSGAKAQLCAKPYVGAKAPTPKGRGLFLSGC